MVATLHSTRKSAKKVHFPQEPASDPPRRNPHPKPVSKPAKAPAKKDSQKARAPSDKAMEYRFNGIGIGMRGRKDPEWKEALREQARLIQEEEQERRDRDKEIRERTERDSRAEGYRYKVVGSLRSPDLKVKKGNLWANFLGIFKKGELKNDDIAHRFSEAQRAWHLESPLEILVEVHNVKEVLELTLQDFGEAGSEN